MTTSKAPSKAAQNRQAQADRIDAALSDLRKRHARASAEEKARWGKPLSKVEPVGKDELRRLGLSRADIAAAVATGKLEPEVYTVKYDQRRGLFGRDYTAKVTTHGVRYTFDPES